MSIPAAMTGPVLGAVSVLNPIDSVLHVFNSNPYFIGMMMLLLNLGGRFISLEVTKQQEQFLQLPSVRRVLIFTVLFVATRNLWVAFWTTLMVILFLGYLFNENSSLCLFGEGGTSGSSCQTGGKGEGTMAPKDEMTPEEKEILHRLSAKAQRYQPIDNGQKRGADKEVEQENVPASRVYSANLSLLRG